MTSTVGACSRGFGLGHLYAQSNIKLEEVRQGKNFYFTTIFQCQEISIACALIQEVAHSVWHHSSRSMTAALNLAPIAWLPIGIFLAAVKQNDYNRYAGLLADKFPETLGRILPRSMSFRTAAVLNFIADHSEKVIKTAIAVSFVALTTSRFYAFGLSFALIFLFHEIDRQGYLPRKVSLLAERYLPIVAEASLLIGGATLVTQCFTAASLLSRTPYVSSWILYKVDRLVKHFLRLLSPQLARLVPSLQAYEEPLVPQTLSYDQMVSILSGEATCKINLAHCSKAADTREFPKNEAFEQFLDLFDQVRWEEKPDLVKAKLRDDERFLDFLKGLFPDQNGKERFDALVQALAQQAGQSEGKFLTEWVRGELLKLVQVLKGEVPPKGEQKDLAVAIEKCAMILSFLQRAQIERVEREDILFKLAVEGGGYCARGIKRASGEIVDDNVMSVGLPTESFSPQKQYVGKILQALQNQRRDIIQYQYTNVIQHSDVPDAISRDVHGFDLYRLYLSLGFYPLSPLEREQIGISEVLLWDFYSSVIHPVMLLEYYRQLEEAFSTVGEVNFAPCMADVIHNNDLLSETQKQDLIHRLMNMDLLTKVRFHKLFLVHLGVLKFSAIRRGFLNSGRG